MRTARTIRQTHREEAFTIVEILLAIAIFSMVLAAIYASWSSILRGSRIGLTAAAEVQRRERGAAQCGDGEDDGGPYEHVCLRW